MRSPRRILQEICLPGACPCVPIFSNPFKDEILGTGEAVAVVVTAGDQSASGRYEFGSDGCRVHKLAGPDTLEVE